MRFLFSFCFIIVCSSLFSQINTAVIETGSTWTIKLQKDTTYRAFGINLSKLAILDARDDTSSIGYIAKGEIRKYTFKSGFKNELGEWFSNYLRINDKNQTGTTLLVNVKKLRLSNEVMPKIYENGHVGQPNQGWGKGVVTKIEYYLQKDSFFIPLYRFDSIITLKNDISQHADEFISTALKLSLTRLFEINFDAALLSKNKIGYKDILRVNRQTYDLPVYNDKIILQKGVYKTFDEFKMKKVSISDFELRKGTMGDILYVKENGNEYPSRNAWGYCDGENIFINSGDKYSKLIRSGNTFYFMGVKSISRNTKHNFWKSSAFNYATDSGEKKTVFKIDMKYYQLDMETGEVY